jgi:hypothetical protein
MRGPTIPVITAPTPTAKATTTAPIPITSYLQETGQVSSVLMASS